MPSDRLCLITDNGTPLTAALVGLLKEQGWSKIAVLTLPSSLVNSSPPHTWDGAHTAPIADIEDSALANMLEGLQRDFGPAGSLIHLHPEFDCDLSSEVRFPKNEKEILKLVFLLAKHLAGPLKDTTNQGRAVFMTVTRIDGRIGFQPANNRSPIAGGLNGLVKTAAIEWERVFCRAVDISPEINELKAAAAILSEMSDPDTRIKEAGLSAGRRVTLSADEKDLPLELSSTPEINESRVFLVAGGGKGVTAACVKELAQRHRCRFILLGRSALLQKEPDWADHCTDDAELKKRCMDAFKAAGEKPTPRNVSALVNSIHSSREILGTIRDIEAAGARAVYLSADINDADALQQKLKAAVADLGEITAIIHGAGVLADKLIEKKTAAEFDAVYASKVEGLNSLLNAVSLGQLSHLILFSSAAGFYGNEAQADYAAANEILNKFAHLFKQHYPQCHVISFNWGPWDGGMVTPALKNLFKERNIEIIPIAAGAEILADELQAAVSDTNQVIVGSAMTIPRGLTESLATFHISRRLSLEENPFLQDHKIGDHAVLPFITAISWMAESCGGLYPGYRLLSFRDAQVFKGVTFEDSSNRQFDISVKEIQKDEARGRIDFDVRISSAGSGERPVYHYGSRIRLTREPPGEPPITTVPDLLPANGQDAADRYRNGTLFHGPVFQSVLSLQRIDESELVLACRTPIAAEAAQGRFPVGLFNYFAEDACLQALLIWVRHFHQAGSLPLKIRKGEFFRPVPFNREFLITLKPEEDSNLKLSATIVASDTSGNVYSRFEGAEAAVSRELDAKFKR